MKKNDEEKRKKPGLTRRDFLKLAGTGAAVTSVAGTSIAEAAKTSTDEAAEMIRVNLIVNGRRRRVLVEPRWSLLYVLREELGLTGTKIGCERGECGACTVLIDGQTRYACLTFAAEAEGKEITTVEGLMQGEELGPVQRAFHQHDAYQCGYCTPGQIMAAEGLLRRNPNPSLEEIRKGMSGNLCRCGAYQHIFQAVQRAAELKKAGGGK